MKIGIFLGHPAQFHLFKNMAKCLREKGYEIEFLVKRKDILEKLVKESGFKYTVVRKKERQSSKKLNLIWEMIKMDLYILRYIICKRPQVIIGTYCPIFSRVMPVSFIICNEDDVSLVPRFAKLAYPAASAILTPITCDCGKWNSKAIKYAGFQKLAYLHPNQFKPNKSIVEKYLGKNYKQYILIRFAKLNAHHDGGAKGITDEIAKNIIKKLEGNYQVFISSERPLNSELESYRLKIDPMDMHHLMAFSDLFIGDSQSMAVESAILGTPNIRFNSFAGQVGVMKELEEKYHLIIGISSEKPDVLLETIDKFLNTPDISTEYKRNRKKLIQDKIDVTQFMTWFVENYPDSRRIIKNDPNYQYNFK